MKDIFYSIITILILLLCAVLVFVCSAKLKSDFNDLKQCKEELKKCNYIEVLR